MKGASKEAHPTKLRLARRVRVLCAGTDLRPDDQKTHLLPTKMRGNSRRRPRRNLKDGNQRKRLPWSSYHVLKYLIILVFEILSFATSSVVAAAFAATAPSHFLSHRHSPAAIVVGVRRGRRIHNMEESALSKRSLSELRTIPRFSHVKQLSDSGIANHTADITVEDINNTNENINDDDSFGRHQQTILIPTTAAVINDSFETFQSTTIKHLQTKYGGEQFIRLIPNNDDAADLNKAEELTPYIQSIKSLVFQAQPSQDIILVLLPTHLQVDTSKLLSAMTVQQHEEEEDDDNNNHIIVPTVSLAPSEELYRLCGFHPGTVPPIGLTPPPAMVVMDTSLIQAHNHDYRHNQQGPPAAEDYRVVGGGGHPDWRCVVSIDVLLQQPNVRVADVAREAISAATAIPVDTNMVSKVNGSADAARRNEPTERNQRNLGTKPYFPLSPPPLQWVEKLLEHPDMVNPLSNEPITVVGRITATRRMAKQLVFCDLGPPTASSFPTISSTSSTIVTTRVNGGSAVVAAAADDSDDDDDDDGDDDDHPWRSGVDGQAMAIQLIAGKTLCEQEGDGGPAALRSLRPGLLVLVNARTNVLSRESLVNWKTKRSLDLVVISYQILEERPKYNSNRVQPMMNEGVDIRLAQQKQQQVEPLIGPNPRQTKGIDSIQIRQPSNFTILRLVDLLGETETGNSSKVTLVDDLTSIEQFSNSLTDLLLSLTTTNDDAVSSTLEDERTQFGWIGIDCEWRPSFYSQRPNDPQPVLLLQVCMKPLNRVFLFDLQSLLRSRCVPMESMTPLEAAVSEAFANLWLSTRWLKCGFQLSADLRRLAASYPHIIGFQHVNAVVEVSSFAKRVLHMTGQRNSRYWTSSLARTTEYFLKKTLSKEQQVSDWSLRPLTMEQMEYAALDAAISPTLVEMALKAIQAEVVCSEKSETFAPRLSRWQGDDVLANCVHSYRFLFLDSEDPAVIRMLRAKKIVGDLLVMTQSWTTGRSTPNTPTAPVNDGPFVDVSGATRVPTRALSICNPIITSTLNKLTGQVVAKSKERCLQTILQGAAGLPRGASLEFSQRSGYVEFKDGVALFVNMPEKCTQVKPRAYPNAWLENGRILTWYLREYEWGGGESRLAKKLMSTIDTEDSLVVLFVRIGKDPFLFCGRCDVRTPHLTTQAPLETDIANGWNLMLLNLHLSNFATLSVSDEFKTIVGL